MTYTGSATATRWEPYTYRESDWTTTRNLVDYKVEATDGEIGKVDQATYDVGKSYLIVDTGMWIFGKKVMLPAGVVQHVDHEKQRVMVDRTKDQIKNAPEFDETRMQDQRYHDELGIYYGEGGAGWYGDR